MNWTEDYPYRRQQAALEVRELVSKGTYDLSPYQFATIHDFSHLYTKDEVLLLSSRMLANVAVNQQAFQNSVSEALRTIAEKMNMAGHSLMF